ncbi:proteasome component Ecm29p [[Candida] anglica]|uniref:Proteasome component Ecm29p n=1 Tax=[Candida] anglica TaxID=148631 RepID=A0ABP0E8C8_9ASCO
MESELSLINKVELRIALAADDVQFENALKLYLTPLLLKLASPHSQVRSAILKIVQYLIPRITAARSVKLPVEQLLAQVKDPKVPQHADPSTMRLYSLIFITKFIDRVSGVEVRQLISQSVFKISEFPANVAARLFNLFCKLLVNCSYKAPGKDTEEYQTSRVVYRFDTNPQDELFVTKWIGKFFMLQPNPASVPPTMCPGLSAQDVKFLTQDAGVLYKSNQEITEVKAVLLQFLDSGCFLPQNLAIPYVIASCDGSSSINDPADILFRNLNLDYEDSGLIDSLFSLLVGDEGSQTPPVKSTTQDQILNLLLKSNIATRHPDISKVASIGFSSDYARLKQTTVQFIRWVSKSVVSKDNGQHSDKFGGHMAAQLKSNLISEGWPKIDTSVVKNYSTAIGQRQLQYEALGELLKANPALFQNDLSYIEFLFYSLEGDDTELRTIIQDALSGLTVHLPALSEGCKNGLKRLIKEFLVSEKQEIPIESIQSCRYIAIKFANCCFPFHDATARYLCVLGTSKTNRSDTVDEALKGLHPHWFNILQASNTLEFRSTSDLLGQSGTVEFPDFSDMVYTLYDALNDANISTLSQAMGNAISFTFQTLVMQAVKGKTTVIVTDEDWSTRLEKALEVDETVQKLLIGEILNVSHDVQTNDENAMTDRPDKSNSFIVFLNIIFNAFAAQYNANGVTNVGFGISLTRILSLSPGHVIESLSSLINRLFDLLQSKQLNDVALEQVSQSLAIIASHPSVDDGVVSKLLDRLVRGGVTSPSVARAKLLASSYLMSRLTLRQRIGIITSELLSEHLNTVAKSLKDVHTYNHALDSISQLALFGLLGPELKLVDNLSEIVQEFKDEIQKKVKKCDEKSVITLAHFSLAFNRKSNDEKSDEFEQLIYDTHVSKQTEFIFSGGEAFSILAAGWNATVLKRQLDIQGAVPSYIPENITRLPYILELVLNSCNQTKPSLRRSGCIWLLSLVQFCGHLKEVQDKAAKIHVTFMRFLADRDELIQESASRGLSIVYELGDYELKDTLVRGLLKSFTDSKSTSSLSAGSVDHDTELFEPELLKTNDGSVSTYKDVLNLASDVGDPSLVYKFMSLAKSSALWSSRKGMAFGLGSILSKSSLDDMLKNNKNLADRLIPKLYRYRYDPSTSVAKSMNDIWNVLIKDSAKTIKDNFGTILPELLKGMGNKEWRVRQASTAALIDLLQVTDLEVYESKLEEIWGMSFRSMDDIKESVRKEGNKLTKSLATTLTRTVEKGAASASSTITESKAKDTLTNLIPFLLGSKGLLSDAEDVRNFALETILKLVKVGGSAIKPFIPDLIDNFISLMSTLEPQIVNYLVLNADKYNIKNEEIDAKRLQSLGQSPMMDAIEKMLDHLDDSLMDRTVTVLQQSIKKSIGLPSKVCGSKVLVSLVVRHLELSKPYGDKLLKTCLTQIGDKNDAIATSYATAAGYLCRISSLNAIAAYADNLLELYFESDFDRSRLVCAVASESVAKYSKDKFESIASSFLPLAFIGQHDPLDNVREPFEREWIENTSGNSSIKLYLKEIIELSHKYLNSRSYEVRQIIAKAIADAVNNIDSTNEFSVASYESIFNILLEACKGKSWSGKEFILEALILFSVKSSKFLKDGREDLLQRIEGTIRTEIKRRNKVYQKQAIKLASKFLFTFPDDDLVEVYTEIMDQIVSDEYEDDSDDEDDMQIDNKESIQLTVKREEDRLTFIKSLFDSYNPILNTNSEYIELVFSAIPNLFNSPNIKNTWRSKLVSCECIQGVSSKLEKVQVPESTYKQLLANWKVLSRECLGPKDIENIKLQFVKASKSILKLQPTTETHTIIKTLLKDYESTETSTVILKELQNDI